jgi:type III secretion protein Q
MTCLESEPWSPLAAELVRYDPQWLALHNRLHRLRQGWSGQCAGHAVNVQWGSAHPVQAGVTAQLTLGAAPFKMVLPIQALELLGLADAALTDLSNLPDAMLLELALLELIEPIEQLAGLPLNVVAQTSDADEAPYVLSTVLQLQLSQDAPISVALHLSAAAATLFADLLEQHAPAANQPLSTLRLPGAVQAGDVCLSLKELRSLNPGDVVMLDHWTENQALLVVDQRLQARAELDGPTLRLLEQPIAVNLVKEPLMTEAAAPQHLDSTLDDLPLKLVCQVGSVELSLAQLRELGAGSLVQLTPQLDDGVDLMVNGRRVGQGQLVKIGDGLGVRLLSFAHS